MMPMLDYFYSLGIILADEHPDYADTDEVTAFLDALETENNQ